MLNSHLYPINLIGCGGDPQLELFKRGCRECGGSQRVVAEGHRGL